MRLQKPTFLVCVGHAWDVPRTCRLVPGKPGWAHIRGLKFLQFTLLRLLLRCKCYQREAGPA